MEINYHEQLLKLFSENLPDMLWVKDLEGNYIFANKAIAENLLMAENVAEVIGKNDLFFTTREREKHSDNPEWYTFGELCFDSDLEVIEQKKAMRFEEYGKVKGKMLYLDVNKAPFYDDNNNVIGTLGSARDITELKKIQLKLKKDALALENSQRIAEYGIWEIDMSSGKITWSKSLYDIYGVDKETFEPTIENANPFMSEEDRALMKAGFERILKNKSVEEVSFSITRADGKILHMIARAEGVFDESGKAVKVVGVSIDVTAKVELINALKKSKEKFAYQANHDSLTDLPNRVLLSDRLEQSIALAKRHKSKLAVIFIDLDHFKEVNDSLGHEIGDKVLVEVAGRMSNVVRKSDTLARLGGDEFCVILNDIENKNDIIRTVESGMQVVKEPLHIDGHTIYLSMSVGVSIYPADGEDIMTLLRNSDAAMYEAKAKGRNRHFFYSKELTKKAVEYISLESALREGIKSDQFIPYFQPQIDSKSEKLIGMELLVRWNHPTMGLVAPYKFIPLAEKVGLIVDLDRLVMQHAMKQFKTWYKEGLNPGVLSMNLAIKNLEDPKFIDVFKNLIEETQLETKYIELEITESDIMSDPETSISKLNELSAMGITIAIDDFGTGYSSLAYLKRLPICKLKIDKSFVDNLPLDEEDCAITRTIIGLCKNLHLDVIAEGVETKVQKDYLLQEGCEKIQGYFYAKPMHKEDMTQFLKNFQL